MVINKSNDITQDWQQFLHNNEHHKEFKMISTILRERQLTLLGHIIRADNSDPTKQVTIDDNLSRPSQFYKKQGRMRYNWVTENVDYAYRRLYENVPFDPRNQTHVDN